MNTETGCHLITLHRVWDLSVTADDPRNRSPDALMDRHATFFAEEPGPAEIEAARGAEKALIEGVFDKTEAAGFVVVPTDAWSAMKSKPGWTRAGLRRHPQGGNRLLDLTLYGLTKSDVESRRGEAWRPAPTCGPTMAQAMDTLRHMAIEQGLEPGPIEPEAPSTTPVPTRPRRRRRIMEVGHRKTILTGPMILE